MAEQIKPAFDKDSNPYSKAHHPWFDEYHPDPSPFTPMEGRRVEPTHEQVFGPHTWDGTGTFEQHNGPNLPQQQEARPDTHSEAMQTGAAAVGSAAVGSMATLHPNPFR